MSFIDDLYAYLTEAPDLQSVVGDRIYPLRLPEPPTLPAITVQRISAPYPFPTQNDPGPQNPRIRLTGWGDTYEDAQTVGNAIKAALFGDVGPGTGHTLESDQDDDDPGTGLMRRRLEYLFYADE